MMETEFLNVYILLREMKDEKMSPRSKYVKDGISLLEANILETKWHMDDDTI